MNSSGIKRGLATSAVAALAVAGLPATAQADTVAAQVGGDDIVLYTGYDTNVLSTRFDGQNNTVRLEAGAGAEVTSVTFQYSLNNGAIWTDIAAVNRNDDGAFAHEWNAAQFNGVDVQVRAIETGTNADGTTLNSSLVESATVQGINSESVNLNDASQVGVFQAPYGGSDNVIVAGTASSGGEVVVSQLTGGLETADTDNNAATPEVPVNAASVEEGRFQATVATGAETATFKGVIDLDGSYNFTPGDTNQLVLGATKGSDSIESYSLYRQTITQVTAEADDTNVPAGETATVTVTVTDQNGQPIAGARVAPSDDVTAQKFTDENGRVTYEQGDGTAFYYADATDNNGYDANLGDERSADITVGQFNAAPTSLAATSDDGTVFDFNENDANDITVQVKNQNGGNIDVDSSEQEVHYYYVVTPFGSNEQIRVPATTENPPYYISDSETDSTVLAPEGTSGEFAIQLPDTTDFTAAQLDDDGTLPSGQYQLFAALTADANGTNMIDYSNVLTFKAGDAELSFDEVSPEQAEAGTQEEVSGSIKLEDGTGLPGRDLTLTFARGTAGTDTAPDAGLGSDRDLSDPAETAANGSFSVTVDDLAEDPQRTEIGGVLTVDTTGDLVVEGDNTQGVDFVEDVTPASVDVTLTADAQGNKPGVAQDGSVVVRTADDPDTTGVNESRLLSNETVTLTITDGFFTNGNADPAAADEADAGELGSRGQQITVTTDENGRATFQFAIERNVGFDDDGEVTTTVTATAGDVSDDAQFTFSSEDPLNGGTVEVVPTGDAVQESSALPNARTDQDVVFDVFVTDQFGNRVGGETVTISDNSPFATVDTNPATANVNETTLTTDYDELGDFTLSSGGREGDVAVTASWTTETLTFEGTAGGTEAGTETLTDSYTVSFYEADFAQSEATIANSTGGQADVNELVTETVKVVDQFGQPVEGFGVEFLRTGPGEDDENVRFETVTDEDGVATYNFIGSDEGTARISAVVRQPDGTQVATLQDTVVFGEDDTVTPPRRPALRLFGKWNGVRNNIVIAETDQFAAGATIWLWNKHPDGRWRKPIQTKTVPASGRVVFRTTDYNRFKLNQYRVKVAPQAGVHRPSRFAYRQIQ